MADIPGITLESQWGYVLGQFKWVYAFFRPISGYVAGRFSRRGTICASLFAQSFFSWSTGQVTTYEGLLWTRTAMGLSEPFYIPAAARALIPITTAVTRGRGPRGSTKWASIAGVILGGFAVYAAYAPDRGWLRAFDFTGLAGILYAIPT